MKTLHKMLAIVATFLFTLSLSSCSPKKQEEVKQPEGNPELTLGLMGSVDAIPFVIAEEKGYFKNKGVKVNLEIFKSAKDRDAAFQGGTLDGIIGDQVAICLYQNADFDVKITGITDGDFMLIASAASGIKSLKDIKGKSVAISEKTLIEYTLDKILEKSSMKVDDIKKSVVPAMPTRLEMLRNNKVDAALLPEPFSTLAIKEGGILLGSANQQGMFPSVSAFTQKSIDTKASSIKAFYKAYNEAVEYINNTPITEYESTVIKTVGYPEDMKGKISLPKFRKNTLPSEEELKAAIDWTESIGVLKKKLNPKDFLSEIGIK